LNFINLLIYNRDSWHFFYKHPYIINNKTHYIIIFVNLFNFFGVFFIPILFDFVYFYTLSILV